MDRSALLTVYHVDKKVRYGAQRDGGYVIADLKDHNQEDNPYDIYLSAGVSDEESFSRDFIQAHGMSKETAYAFDGTIHDYPYHYTREIQFVKKNIHHQETVNTTNLSTLLEQHRRVFLKMDIEGGEYPWLFHLDPALLKNIKQLVIEFHGITQDNNEWGAIYPTKIQCLEKLAQTHYLIHAHGNNFGRQSNGIPDVIELTYVNKNHFPFPPPLNRQPLPLPGVDFPNNPNAADFPLTAPPFVAP